MAQPAVDRPVSGVDSYRAVVTLPFALRTFVPALGGRLAPPSSPPGWH
jgi:hypothetical protein